MNASLRFRVLAGIMIFFAFVVAAAKITDPDFYWHLRDGETILATHAVPHVDFYSYTMANTPWVDHEWLIEAGLAWTWNHGIAWTLPVFFAILAFIPFAIWLRRYRTWPDLWVISAAAALFMMFLSVRPQVLSYLFFFIVFEILSRYYDGKNANRARGKRYLLVLPLIFFIWANIHAQFISGLVLFAVFFATDAAMRWWREKKITWNDIPFAAGVLVASAATPLANPYGAGLYGEIFRVMFSGNTMKYIQEWQPLFSMQTPFSPQIVAIAFILSVFILLVVRHYKQVTPTRLAAVVVFFLLFLKAQRMGPLFVIAAIPFMHEGLTHAFGELSSRWHLAPPWIKKVFQGIGIVLSVVAIFIIVATPTTLAAPQYPAAATDFLNQQVAQGEHIVILNDYSWGGYLIWNAPEIKVFIDGRMPHWIAPDGTSAMKDYVDIFLSQKNFSAQEAILKKWGVNTILISTDDVNGGNAALVDSLKLAGWSTVYSDSTATVLQNAGALRHALLTRTQ